jgi:hypothetical protein
MDAGTQVSSQGANVCLLHGCADVAANSPKKSTSKEGNIVGVLLCKFLLVVVLIDISEQECVCGGIQDVEENSCGLNLDNQGYHPISPSCDHIIVSV